MNKLASFKRFLLVPVLILAGCQTGGAPVLLATLSEIAGTAAQWGVQHYPQHRAKFEAAQIELTGLLDSQNFDGAAFAAAMSRIPALATGLAGPEGDLYIQGGLIVFRVLNNTAYAVTSKPAVRQILVAVRDGLTRGLAAPGVTRSLMANRQTYTVRDHSTAARKKV